MICRRSGLATAAAAAANFMQVGANHGGTHMVEFDTRVRNPVVNRTGIVPSPGQGNPAMRHRILAELGRADLSMARLGAAHIDALAILHEGGREPLEGSCTASGPAMICRTSYMPNVLKAIGASPASSNSAAPRPSSPPRWSPCTANGACCCSKCSSALAESALSVQAGRIPRWPTPWSAQCRSIGSC